MSEEVKTESALLDPAAVARAEKLAAKKEASDFPFAVAVGDLYEGPLDLLLDLIRKQDIDKIGLVADRKKGAAQPQS